jgi:predicted Zn-ribbon and HTH transcriptional regulator
MRVGWPKRCPRCGSREIVDVLYGTPDDSGLRELWLSGKAMLRPGRCGDGPPGWACRECGLESKEIAEARAS